MHTSETEKMPKSTQKSNDFLGLANYPKYKKIYNFYIRRYVYLPIGEYLEEDPDIINYHACDYDLSDISSLP